MSKKIVAIGGGENGRIDNSGNKLPYETDKIDKEIIKLTNKTKPNFLFLGHSQNSIEAEKGYFETMKKIYGDLYGCECKNILKEDLINNTPKVLETIEWSDIIYEGGGDTKGMIELWEQTEFDRILKESWEKGKVMCGVSAGANCWFKSCSSDSLKIQLNDPTAPMITLECLNFINAFFTPHCNVANENTNRLQHMKESLQNTNQIGIALSNCAAIEIIDDKYRLITSDASNYGIKAYGIKGYWKDEKYYEEKIEEKIEFTELKNLITIN